MSAPSSDRLNLADNLLTDRVREGRGDRVALRLDDRNWTYLEVDALAARSAGALRRHGVRQEERVLLALPDGADLVAALFGVLRLGAVAVTVNPQLGKDELAALLDYGRPTAAVVGAGSLAAFHEAAETARWTGVLLTHGDAGAGPRWETAVASAEPVDAVATHPDDPALWLFSGGTTGRPKAVVQTHRSFANTTELYAVRCLGYREDDVTISVPKLFFGYATGSNLFFPFRVGASAVLFAEPPTPEALFARIARHRATILIHVPTAVQRMVSHPEAAAQNLSSLRFATSAGEALPVPLYERWKATFGVELLDGLGTAEQWHIFVTNRPGDVKPGSLGRVVEGFELKVADEDGNEVPAGEVGRLWVRGGSRALGYWRNLDKTAEAFRGEWFVGGDLVRRDADGYVWYCGRADDVLKVGGKWLVPAEVESCLAAHPAVAECAVIGAEDADGLTKPFAFVVARETAETSGLEETLKAWTLARLPAYKHPRRIHVVPTFPRTHLGKVDRGALRRRLGD